MLNNGIFDFTGFTGFDRTGFNFNNSSVASDLFDYNEFDKENKTGLQDNQYASPSDLQSSWYLQPPKVGGVNPPYTGVEVLGNLNGPSHLCDPITAPTMMYPRSQVSPDEGKSCSASSKVSFRNLVTRNRIQPNLPPGRGHPHPPTTTYDHPSLHQSAFLILPCRTLRL